MNERMNNPVMTRFSNSTLKRMDSLIEKKKFDNRSNFIRRAVNDFLEQQEKVIMA